MIKFQKEVILAALEDESELTERESEFISDVAEFDDDFIFSISQAEWLRKIGAKYEIFPEDYDVE